MAKKKHKRRQFPPKRFYLYINDDGTQYLPEGVTPFAELAEDALPEDVAEFWVDVRVLTGQYSINSSKAATDMVIKAQMSGKSAESAASAAQDLAYQEMFQALVGWSLEDDNDNPIPINGQTLAELEPGWLYDAINEAYQTVNSLSKNWRSG